MIFSPAVTSVTLWERDTWPLCDHQAEEDDLEIITITTTTATNLHLTTRARMRSDPAAAVTAVTAAKCHFNFNYSPFRANFRTNVTPVLVE